MRLRITLALVALLALSLFLAGGVSLVLVRHAQSDASQQALEKQAGILVSRENLHLLTGPDRQNVLNLAQQLTGFSADVTVIDQGVASPAPPIVPLPKANIDQLLDNEPTVTSHNHVALALAPLTRIVTRNPKHPSEEQVEVVALYLEAPLDFSADNVWFFFLAGGASLLVAAVVASVISQRIAHRVRDVASAARQIATGDLAVRLDGAGRRTYPELRELDTSINTMAADLGRAQEAERDFLLAISHEFRTPLTSIRGYSEAITEGAVSDPMHAAAIVTSEAERLERLIGDLLDLARLRSRQFTLDLGEIDAVGLCRQSTEALRLAFAAEGLELNAELPEGTALVVADYHRLSQVVANLLENAGKFAASRIELVVRPGEERVRISVLDDGPGIAPEDLPFIFQRLFKSDRRPGRTSGSGLGLAIVAELADAMGAQLIAHSPLSPEGGTEMILDLRRPATPSGAPGGSDQTRAGR